MTKKLSRKKFLGLSAGAAAGSALVACAAPASPQVVVEKEVPKEVQVVRTVIVEMAKEMQVTVPPLLRQTASRTSRQRPSPTRWRP